MSGKAGPRRDLVVLGGSAGGVEALTTVIAGLPADLPAAVLVVLHMPAQGSSNLAAILDRCGPLPVSVAEDGAALRQRHVWVAVPGRHLLVRDGHMILSSAPKQNRARPSIDALFRSAARWRGTRTVAAVLSGNLDDGAVGLATIDAAGGACIVQDPGSAICPGMPQAALAAVPHAVALTAAEISHGIQTLIGEPVAAAGPTPNADLIAETDMAEHKLEITERRQPGRPAALSCPDCTGGMNIVESGAAVHYTCHIGHIWSPQSLVAAQQDKIEQGLWTALSILEEQARVYDDLAARGGTGLGVRHQRDAAEEIRGAADVIRKHFPDIVLDN
ncbi:chemotaxis protein CheB [Paractinoplanes abujensis]|uniref:protein-glutamate methylesterase n=1 Tax=Paractinoplanes abujensis TaxID=882441 RepID=A0A7W7FYH9_9ACTN|nr:chemotaxis protein CheB [Actinoplanes abujensis]MBB4691058.1 two-component system chemotaxis response regulator CheB [Actinoplanes abujensis]GID17530.1 chemotaxis protein CheB [Actinoplanes abujensis]